MISVVILVSSNDNVVQVYEFKMITKSINSMD